MIKKILPVILLCSFVIPVVAQNDPADLELKRLREMGDSMRKAQQTRESLFLRKMNEHVTGARRDVANQYQSQVDEAYKQVLKQQEKAAARRKMTLLVSVGAVLGAGIVVWMIRNKKSTGARNG